MKINLPIIIEGCQRNDLLSQQQLYKYCYAELIKICYRYGGDADAAGSIFNNAMLKVFRSIATYKEEGKLMGWIKTIVVNCCIDHCKQQSVFIESISNGLAEEIYIRPDALDHVAAKEIQQLIRQLPPATALVFNLYVYEGYNHRQISEIIGISSGTSKWHLSEGKKIMKQYLEKHNPVLNKANAAG